jgi:hypothetical protein
MYRCIPMKKIQIQTLTHGYHDSLFPDVFKNVVALADALSRLDIDSLKIQEEEVLTLLSGSENNSIISIKFPMNTTLNFKEQA